jgi:hypothetical protein
LVERGPAERRVAPAGADDDQFYMSSLALPPAAGIRVPASGRLAAVLERRGVDVLLAVAVLSFAATLIAFLPGAFSVDSWLALVTGREVWQTGVPHHEVLTALSHGIKWIDQQWLAQLATYALYRLGGLGLVGVVNVVLMAVAAGGAVIGARKLGAPPRAVLIVLPFALWMIAPSHEVRTQEFAMPLFVATTYLLASDSRSPSRRVYWCLPMLALWANLHGSVTLGAALVALRGVTVAWERRHELLRSRRAWRRPLALIIGPCACLFATPYGPGIISYYRTMFFGSSVMHSITEWQPVTSVALIAVPFFFTAAVTLWWLGRTPSRLTLWEQLSLLVLAAGSIEVIRNVLFFGLFALLIVPLLVSGRLSQQADATRSRGRLSQQAVSARGRVAINGALLFLAVATLVIGSASALVKPSSWIELNYERTGVLNTVERVARADPAIKVLSDVRFSDWLLWRDTALSGRVANDARWELLTASQMGKLESALDVIGPNWQRGARGYRLIVMDQRYDASAVQAFRSEPGSRVLYDEHDQLVILRSAAEAG